MRIVIAEDSVLLREGLTRLLVDAGEEIVAAVGDAVEGVVIGQALYTGRLSLPEALAAAAA